MKHGRAPIAWWPMVGVAVAGASLAAVILWQAQLRAIDAQIHQQRAAIKKLGVSGNIPPTPGVVDYLESRGRVMQQRYEQLTAALAAPAIPDAAAAHPQLFFEEQLQELRRSFERLATAHAGTVPELLGVPKELPPTETVPRLLIQLQLVQETATLVFEQNTGTLVSLKLEDPEPVPENQGDAPVFTRIPVRIRVLTSTQGLMSLLAALERSHPLVDVRGLHVTSATEPGQLESELLLSRYLIAPPSDVLPVEPEHEAASARPNPPPSSSTRSKRSAH